MNSNDIIKISIVQTSQLNFFKSNQLNIYKNISLNTFKMILNYKISKIISQFFQSHSFFLIIQFGLISNY